MSDENILTIQTDNNNKIRYPQECKLCHYHWQSRLQKPKQCPTCKRMDWNK